MVDGIEKEEAARSKNDNTELHKYAGTWVIKSYIDALKSSKSPYNSFAHLKDINSLLLRPSANGEAINVTVVYNSEATNATMSKLNGEFYIVFEENGQSVKSTVAVTDESLSFDYHNKHYEFAKISNQLSDDGLGLSEITNKILFENKMFHTADNPSRDISFQLNGVVKNFLNYTNYEVITYFETDPDPVDKIKLKTNKHEIEIFHFVFNKKQLLLYKIIESDDRENTVELVHALSF